MCDNVLRFAAMCDNVLLLRLCVTMRYYVAIPLRKFPIGIPIGKIPIGKIPIGILSQILIGIFPIGIFPIGIPIGKIPIGIFLQEFL